MEVRSLIEDKLRRDLTHCRQLCWDALGPKIGLAETGAASSCMTRSPVQATQYDDSWDPDLAKGV